MISPARGSVWFADLDPIRGHEQGGRRPIVIISDDPFNQSAAELVIVVPITSKHKGIPWHIPIPPPEAGLKQLSFAKCEDVRSISKLRLSSRLGQLLPQTLALIEDRLKILLKL